MSKDDDDDDSANIGVGRYPCMPSLVALQQMRNRLHLAFLGKKLMKWSALATGRELRKIAMELNNTIGDFSDDLSNAYIMLARSRYYYPNLNMMVLENIEKEATITIGTSLKTVSAGVKCISYDIMDTGVQPYQHLGIDKGGQMIKETKITWAELLKKMILLLQLRNSFSSVEAAHKSATKKMNVLAKIVIPKTELSIHYILAELEEHAREEYFRMKKILQVKTKNKKLKAAMEEKIIQRCCRLCGAVLPEIVYDLSDVQAQDKVDDNDLLCENCRKKGQPAPLSPDYSPTVSPPRLQSPLVLSSPQLDLPPPPMVLSSPQLDLPSPPMVLQSSLVTLPPLRDVSSPEVLPSSTPCIICKLTSTQAGLIHIHIPYEGPSPSRSQGASTTPSYKVPSTTLSITKQSSTEITPLIVTSSLGVYEGLSLTEINLGVIETEISIVTRILRTKHPDGTITEEKKVVRVRKERHRPTSSLNIDSNTSRQSSRGSQRTDTSSYHNYSSDKTVGTACVLDKVPFRSKSDIVKYSNPMTGFRERFCVSLADIKEMNMDSFTIENTDVFEVKRIFSEPTTIQTMSNADFTVSEIQLLSEAKVWSSSEMSLENTL